MRRAHYSHWRREVPLDASSREKKQNNGWCRLLHFPSSPQNNGFLYWLKTALPKNSFGAAHLPNFLLLKLAHLTFRPIRVVYVQYVCTEHMWQIGSHASVCSEMKLIPDLNCGYYYVLSAPPPSSLSLWLIDTDPIIICQWGEKEATSPMSSYIFYRVCHKKPKLRKIFIFS